MEHFFFWNSKLCNGMMLSINRSSHQRCPIRKGVLRNFAKFTGKHLYLSLFFNKVQKEKRSKMFQVKEISKDTRETIVPSLMFLFNLSKSVVLCVKKMEILYNFHHQINQINKYTWFSCKIFALYRKWKIKMLF